MGMLYLIWRELGMGKFPHSWLSSHSEKEFPHSRLRRSWGNTLSLFLLSHSCGNFFSRLRGFATQGGKIPSLILSRWGIGHSYLRENMQSNKQTKLLTVQCVSAVSVCWFILNISHRAALFASAAKASCTCCSYIDYHHAKREGQSSSSSTTMAAVERKSNFGFLSFLARKTYIYNISRGSGNIYTFCVFVFSESKSH